ncbi:hypothetical protein ACFCYN_14210 [Gottfriedia sp. NPDC056225]|uniref:hypothetical protein n=1 Tax=Gottfriedia sp. NPDC056225 TaxID=3345751 RepID=UPI0035E100BB
MFNKLLIALLSTITFSFLFTCFRYQHNDGFGFLGLFLSVALYSSVIYIIAGTPLSIGVDKWHSEYKYPSKILSYLAKVGMYSIAGMGVMFILFALESQSLNLGIFDDIRVFLKVMLFGTIVSNVFYHVELLFNLILKKKHKNTSKPLLN